jgi:hypothetical protein
MVCECCVGPLYVQRVIQVLFEEGLTVFQFWTPKGDICVTPGQRVVVVSETNTSRLVRLDTEGHEEDLVRGVSKQVLGPCTCQFGDPRLSALSERHQWCVCKPEEVLLAAFEKSIREQSNHIFYQKYHVCSVYIRTVFQVCRECNVSLKL